MNILFILLALALEGALNPSYSPDSTKLAFTRNGDLFVADVATGAQTRLTYDGSQTVLNGRASWVYYEEIFGRKSDYKAFWWSPDSRKIAFFRSDESAVPVFSIFSPFGQGGALRNTRYPKAGQVNPSVRVGIAPVDGSGVVWAGFEDGSEQYFGSPFWSSSSDTLYVQRMPRRQNELDLFAVSAASGEVRSIYHEKSETWVTMINGMLFDATGFYMVRDFETGWQQIYHLSYSGCLERITDGENWDVRLLREKGGMLWFTAKRDSRIHPSLYFLDRNRQIHTLTDPDVYTADVTFDGMEFRARVSTASTPWQIIGGRADGKGGVRLIVGAGNVSYDRPRPKQLVIKNGGFDLYGLITFPRNFDSAKKYPVVMEVYGGPGTAYVRDWWENRDATNRWCWENGVIWMVVDPRSSGENGRRGMDRAFCRMTVEELDDYLAWARYMQSLPYVRADRIGADGFSFGGTTTAMLVLRYPQYFHCGIAGGGVYDWCLYDSIYTERYMLTPSRNPDGYRLASVLEYVRNADDDAPHGILKLTHGTADDNVHFQNTLLLVDALQKKNWRFELMIYPDGMHGYRDAQRRHDMSDAASFWEKTLLK